MNDVRQHDDNGHASREETHTRSETENHNVPGLLRELSREIANLVAKEAELLKAETRGAVNDVKTAITSSGVGVAVLFVGIFWIAGAAVYGLAHALPLWASALVVGGVIAVVGLMMLSSARSKLTGTKLEPSRTGHQVHEDAKLARRKANA